MGGLTFPINTVSGQVIHFEQGDWETPLINLKAWFSPVQEGSGNPSPNNIRAIIGKNILTIFHSGTDASNPETIIATFPTAYGGCVDAITGELTEEYALFTFDGTEPWIAYGGSNAAAMRYTLWLEDLTGIAVYGARTTALCSHFQIMTGNGAFGTLRYSPTSTHDDHSATYIAVNDSEKTQFGGSLDAFTAWLKDQYDNGTPVQLLAKLITPVAQQITPQEIRSFKGVNNFWSGVGDVEVSYYVYRNATLEHLRRRIILNSPHIATVSNDVVSFSTDMTAPFKECKANFFPVQAGSGNPSPTNVRPISGRSGLSLQHCKKNLIAVTPEEIKSCGASANWAWDGNTGTKGSATAEIQTDTGGIVTGILGSNTASSGSQSIDMPLPASFAGQTLTLTGCPSGGGSSKYRLLVQEFEPESQVHARQYGNPVSFTFPDATDVRARMVFQNGYSNILFQPMLTFSDEIDQTYEPYTGQTLDITFQETLYGGYIDLVKGELVKTMEIIDLGTLSWTYAERYNAFRANINGSKRMSAADVLRSATVCNRYKLVGSMSASADDYTFVVNSTSHGVNQVYVKDPRFGTDEEAFAVGMAGAIVAYELETPVIYSIEEQIARPYKGLNNFISDADMIVKFWTH